MATEILRPSGNVNTLWVTNSFSNINEVVINPAAGGGGSVQADDGDESEEQIWSFPSLSSLTAITSVDIHIYHRDTGISGDPPAGVRIKVGGVWSASQDFNYNGTYSWDSNAYGGTWVDSDFVNFEVGVTAPNSIGSGREYELSTLYAEITGTSATEMTLSHSISVLLAAPGGSAQPFTVQSVSRDEYRHIDPVFVSWSNPTGETAKVEFSSDRTSFRTISDGPNNGNYVFLPSSSDTSTTCCFKVTIDGVEATSNEFVITDRRITQYSGGLGRFGV